MNTKHKQWQLDRNEVGFGGGGGGRGGRNGRHLSRQPSLMDLRSVTVNATHIPSGIQVSRTLPEGHYSNSFIRDFKKKVEEELYFELEAKVAREFRIPGFLPRKKA